MDCGGSVAISCLIEPFLSRIQTDGHGPSLPPFGFVRRLVVRGEEELCSWGVGARVRSADRTLEFRSCVQPRGCYRSDSVPGAVTHGRDAQALALVAEIVEHTAAAAGGRALRCARDARQRGLGLAAVYGRVRLLSRRVGGRLPAGPGRPARGGGIKG